ncbi:MAG: SH3 domain-containing protein [Roseobacter sp.]|jgi:hypothetical protein|nr:SH3 domain-containing protein [Roseobacter sp.]
MTRFVLLSFVLLGLGFYELSGGTGFDPQEARVAAVDARVARAAERTPTVVAELTRPAVVEAPQAAPDTPPTQAEVTRTQLDLVSFQAAAAAGTATASTLVAEDDSPPVQAARPQQDPTLGIASLEVDEAPASNIAFAGNRTVAASTQVVTSTDVRSVNADLANLRSGPGTEYDVIEQLTRSTEVEIIASNGNGWVELRPVGTDQTGWIAEFLLTGG